MGAQASRGHVPKRKQARACVPCGETNTNGVTGKRFAGVSPAVLVEHAGEDASAPMAGILPVHDKKCTNCAKSGSKLPHSKNFRLTGASLLFQYGQSTISNPQSKIDMRARANACAFMSRAERAVYSAFRMRPGSMRRARSAGSSADAAMITSIMAVAIASPVRF